MPDSVARQDGGHSKERISTAMIKSEYPLEQVQGNRLINKEIARIRGSSFMVGVFLCRFIFDLGKTHNLYPVRCARIIAMGVSAAMFGTRRIQTLFPTPSVPDP